jgi:putative protease
MTSQSSVNPRDVRRPEILAPAGTLESFAAALVSGADAIYLGLSEGFNARARATAFTLETLPDLVRRAHAANTKLYLTLNTLVFESELADLEALLCGVINAGVDALIVQDPATALLARRLCPQLRLHASTQMTISSAEGARFAATLGVERVVLPRELSASEIAQFTRESSLEAEVFVHGALCMAWSGQCLTSEAFSGRSANRGQCSQACRMPYDAIVDGQRQELGDLRYLLSPGDLAAHDVLPDLVEAGVHSLKIEGRYKGPAYVATAVDSWRNWRDAVLRGPTNEDRVQLKRDIERTQLTFSRGGSVGFLRGDDHQTLVGATTPKHRGIHVGAVLDVRSRTVIVSLARGDANLGEWLRPGMGVKFELVGRSAKEHDPEHAPGGPLFGVRYPDGGAASAELRFGEPGPDLSRVRVGDLVRLTGDPELIRDAERRILVPATGRIPLTLRVSGQVGTPLRLRARAKNTGRRLEAEVVGRCALDVARSGSGLDDALLRDKIGALGGTPFHLADIDVTDLDFGLYVPVAELKQLRRELVGLLENQLFTSVYAPTPRRERGATSGRLRTELTARTSPAIGPAKLVPLCRTKEQLEAVIATDLGEEAEVELDWMDMVGLGRAVQRARAAGLRVTLATVRVQKPGEEAFDRRIAKLAPDAVLVRHWGALMHFARAASEPSTGGLEATADPSRVTAPLVHGDFSLNVTNSLTAQHLLALGLDTITASHDLNKAQMMDLLHHTPRGRVAVTLHHHISTFHNSHCVYAHLLSDGADYRTCGRPCDEHRVALRDYAGHDHPVVVDVSCRNTVFNALAQSAAPLVPQLLDLGVRRFRVEFVWEHGEQVKHTLIAYQRLLLGEITPTAALAAAAVHERYGVTTPLRLRKR